MKGSEAFQDALYKEMLARIKEDDSTVPYRRGAYVYYSRTETGKQYPIHCRRRDVPGAPEEITLDLNRMAEGHAFLSLGVYTVSDDGRLLAYSVDFTGFRDYTLHVKDLESGALLPDRVEKVSSAAWSADNSILFYVTEDEAKRPYRLWRHRLGAADDDLLLEETDELFRLGVFRSRSRKVVFAAARSFTSGEYRWLPAAEPFGEWRMILPREKDHEYDVDHGLDASGERFWIRTNGGGRRNFRLVTAPMDDARGERWTEVLAHREEVMLEDFDVFARHVVVHEREDGLIRLRVLRPADGASHHVEFPEPTYEVDEEANAEFDSDRYRFRYQSLVTPASVFDYDMEGRTLALLKRTEVLGGFDPTKYRSERIHATAPDGTRVAISLVTRADAPRDGSSPMLLAGYGAYGLPYPVNFSSSRLSLLDRGVSVALAHVRGGGEGGKRWHDAGRMLAKPNTFTDFVAAADHLVAQGYTARDRLVIEGGSAGGLLIGAVLNRRPDLCAAAVLRVPFVDVINTMLDESLPLTVGEFEEWGNPKHPDELETMLRYSPYDNVTRQDYPAMLVETSYNDSQVRQPGDVLGARQVRGAAARTVARDVRALQDQHGGGPRRRLGPLRLPARDRLRLRLDPGSPRKGRVKIARLEHLHADAGKGALDFLKLTTDDGVVGWSEYNETFGGVGVSAAIDGLAPLVVGKDPRAREAIVTTLYAVRRQAPGGVIQQAIAAIENALLDAQARALGIPVYELLGGPQRQRLRLYWSHCGYFRLFASQQMQIPPLRGLHDIVAQGKEVVARGFTALKTNIFLFDAGAPHAHMPGFARADSEVPGLNAERRIIGALRDQLAAFREGAGRDVDILVDLNFNFRTEGFVKVARAMEPFDLFWVEIDSFDPAALHDIRSRIDIPLASLESQYTRRGYREFFERQSVDVAIVDAPWNGVAESLKIAALADTYEVNIAPHNFYGHLATMMNAHFCALAPNFRIMEIDVDAVPWIDELYTVPPTIEDGHLVLPTGPGWGTEVNEAGVRKHPARRPA